jgi:uncharacterized membrane protein
MRKKRTFIVLLLGIVLLVIGIAITLVAKYEQERILEKEEFDIGEYDRYSNFKQYGGIFNFIGGLIIIFGVVIPFLLERKQKPYKNKTQETHTLIGQTK